MNEAVDLDDVPALRFGIEPFAAVMHVRAFTLYLSWVETRTQVPTRLAEV